MYSYEDRSRAVELFIKLGKRVRATLRQISYPTKNTLKDWHGEYERRLDFAVGYAGRRPKYCQAQKDSAVEHYLNHGQCKAATMRAWGYPAWDVDRMGLRRFLYPGKLPLAAAVDDGTP